MDGKTEAIFMRVPTEEKQRAKDLADRCGLSLTGLWRAMLAEMDVEPVISYRPTRGVTQGSQTRMAVQG